MSPSNPSSKVSGTVLVHGDDERAHGDEVAPSISVSTTFKNFHHAAGGAQEDWDPFDPQAKHVYSRYTQGVSGRVEKILSTINEGHAITYSSGLTAGFAALVHLKPKRVAIRGGYHGFHETVDRYSKCRETPLKVIDLDDEYQAGDLCWLETPLNPTGEARDLKYYADKIHAVGGKLVVDSTFGPPPIQYPFRHGADIVMHSATKYFGGHSDLLAGILIVKTSEEWRELWNDRTYLGAMMGSLESWLLLRSLRTFHLRIPRQSESATKLAQWLDSLAKEGADGIPSGLIEKVWHSSLQKQDAHGWEPSHQMNGHSPTFALLLRDTKTAMALPYALKYFVAATSLGGVESLIEYRRNSDPNADPRLVRVSVGVEDIEDLKADLKQGLQKIAGERSAKL